MAGWWVEEGPFKALQVTGSTQVKATPGFVHTISISPLTATPTAGLVTVYDNTAGSGTVLYSEWVFATTPGHTITLNAPFLVGLYVLYTTVANVTVTASYR